MKREIGKVMEVFIPDKVDIMNSNTIGFKVQLEEGIVEIIQEQDENNANILKNDMVLITKQVISEKEFIDIELYEGENDDR